mgnify:CR=1 FL=1
MSFENFQLHPAILRAVQQCGYTTPTPVQSEAIPKILAGHDVIASANTGTGKTATFVLPALQRLTKRRFSKKQYGKPSVLVLTPTRELANQVTQAIRNYGKNLRFHSVSLVGGMPYGPQLKSLSRPVDMVIATPGRLLDLIERNNLNLSQVNMLVLDEADRMLDMGFVDEVKRIAELTPEDRQTLLFTATWDDSLARLVGRLLKEPERIQIESEPTQHNIEQRVHVADNIEHKNRLLLHLLDDDEMSQALIFSATKLGADMLAQELVSQGHAAAGLDVTSISHVINFDIPRFAEDYVHRIGRTGRAGAPGTAISFVLPDDRLHLERIERYTGQRVPQIIIPGLEPTRSLRRPPQPKKRQSRRGDYSAPRKNYYEAPNRKGGGGRYNQPPPHHHKRQGGMVGKKLNAY